MQGTEKVNFTVCKSQLNTSDLKINLCLRQLGRKWYHEGGTSFRCGWAGRRGFLFRCVELEHPRDGVQEAAGHVDVEELVREGRTQTAQAASSSLVVGRTTGRGGLALDGGECWLG